MIRGVVRGLTGALAWLLLVLPALGRADGRIDYMLHCQGCHLPDGSGLPGAVPPLRGYVGLYLGVPGGRAFLVRVPGSAQSALDDASLAAVLNFVIREFGPAEVALDFAPFDAGEVARYRGEALLEVEAERRALARRIEAARAPR